MKIQFVLCIAMAVAFSGCAGTGSHSEGSPPTAVAQSTEEIPVDVVDVAQPVASTASTSATHKSQEDRDTLVCKDIATIGTRFTQRICKSKAQIAEEKAAGSAWTDPARTLSVPGLPRTSAPVGASNSH
jgi:hypothetical protein